MKRTSIVALALALGLALPVGPAAAQDLTAGIRGGVTFADLDGDDVESNGRESRAGAIVGGYLVWRLSPWLALQPEALFTQKGATFRDPEEGTFDWTISYVEVPVLARGSISVLEGRLRPHLLAGPALALRTGCEAGGRFSGFEFAVPCDSPAFQGAIELKRLDVGAVLGGGVDLAVSGGWLSLDARYALGLTSIDDSVEGGDVHNRALSLSLGVSMPLAR